jgi:hypothetical protein
VVASHVSALVGASLRGYKSAELYSHVAAIGGPLICNAYLEGPRG